MARAFVRATNQYLQIDTPVFNGTPPITMSCWFRSTNVTVDQCLMWVGEKRVADVMTLLVAAGSRAGDTILAKSYGGFGSAGFAESTAGYTGNTWHHALGVWRARNDRSAYIDGGNRGNDNTDVNPSFVYDRTAIGQSADSSPDQYMDGRIAEAAIWNTDLTDAEIAMVATGLSPRHVRPGNLVFYMPLWVDEDNDLVGGLHLTAFNNPTVEDHCRVYYSIPVMPGRWDSGDITLTPPVGEVAVESFDGEVVVPSAIVTPLPATVGAGTMTPTIIEGDAPPGPDLYPGCWVPGERYRVSIIDSDGAQLWAGEPGVDINMLYYERRLDAPDLCNVTFPDVDGAWAALFDEREDCLIEISRLNPDGWRVETTCLFTYGRQQVKEDGLLEFVAHGVGLLSLLERRILYPPDDPGVTAEGYSVKAGVASTVAYDYVDEQAGPASSADRVTAGLTLAGDLMIGNQVGFTAGWEHGSLLELLKELATKGQVDARITRGAGYTFQFEVLTVGEDKSINAYPVGPFVLLSTKRGNLQNMALTRDRNDERTVAYVRGQGQAAARETQVVASPGVASSPVNRREMVVRANEVERDDVDGLMTRGWARLQEERAGEEFEFEMVQGAVGAVYAQDWDLGDLVTVEIADIQQTQRVSAVSVWLSQSGEVLKPTLQVMV